MRDIAGDADHRANLAVLDPYDAARAWTMNDRVIDAAQAASTENGSNVTGLGKRASRAPIQAAWRSANSRAERTELRAGMVSTTSRVAPRTRKVKRRALDNRFSATR